MNGFATHLMKMQPIVLIASVPTVASVQRASLIGRTLLVKREVLSQGIA